MLNEIVENISFSILEIENLIKYQNFNMTKKAIDFAKTQSHVREVKTNSSPEIDKYLKSVGLSPGLAWCTAFLYYCYSQVAKRHPYPKTGLVHEAYKGLKNYHIKKPVDNSLFFIDTGSYRGHAGFVISVKGEKIITIEGNTNDKGSREGNGVYIRERSISSINLGFAKI